MTGDIIVGAAKQGHDLLDWATPIFTLLGVFVVGLYTYYTKKQNELTERSLVLGRRAWVVIRGEPEWSHEDQGWVFGKIVFENVSDTPAVIQQYGVGFLNRDQIKERDMRCVPPWVYQGGGEVIIRGQPLTRIINVVKPPTMEDGETVDAMSVLAPSLYCIVEYIDCFDTTWRTTTAWQEVPDDIWEPIPYYTTLK